MENTSAKAELESRIRQEARFGSIDLALILMTAIWGANFTAIKYSLEDLLPLSFNGLRFVIAAIVNPSCGLQSAREAVG
ncbi:MAG: EamA family transporter [Acidobacteriota bacterium]